MSEKREAKVLNQYLIGYMYLWATFCLFEAEHIFNFVISPSSSLSLKQTKKVNRCQEDEK